MRATATTHSTKAAQLIARVDAIIICTRGRLVQSQFAEAPASLEDADLLDTIETLQPDAIRHPTLAIEWALDDILREMEIRLGERRFSERDQAALSRLCGLALLSDLVDLNMLLNVINLVDVCTNDWHTYGPGHLTFVRYDMYGNPIPVVDATGFDNFQARIKPGDDG